MNNFDRVMQGYQFGVNAVKQYQDAKLEKEAGDAYKNTDQQTSQTANFGKVEQTGLYKGPGSDGVMTNAEAASYGLMQPQSTQTDYTLGGKTQNTAFSDNQIEVARTRAGADVYANAGRMKEASTMRRDAAQMGLTEFQMQSAQRESEQTAAMDSRMAAMPKIDGYYKDGAAVDVAALQAGFEKDGMTPADAMAASTKGLRKTTGADQSSYMASVYLAGGSRYAKQYEDSISKAATARTNQVRRGVNKATTLDEVNAAYGDVEDGKSVRSVPQLDDKGKETGKFQVQQFDDASGKALGLMQGGKVYESLDQFKADANVMLDENPDAFVAHEQRQATRQMDQRKFEQTAANNLASQQNAAGHLAVAQGGLAVSQRNSNTAAANAGLDRELTGLKIEDAKTARDLKKAFSVPEAERTKAQKAAIAGAAEFKNNAGGTPEQLDAARTKGRAAVKDYISSGKNALSPYSADETEAARAMTMVSEVILNKVGGRNINTADVLMESKAILKSAADLKATGFTGTLEDAAMQVMNPKAGGAPAAPAAPATLASPANKKFKGFW